MQSSQFTSEGRARVLSGIVLAVGLIALGFWMVSAHWYSIWMDPEFGGWVAPVANRLIENTRLYDYGMHIPMPPLPFVLVRILCPTEASWITESFLNFTFQAATILLLFWAYARHASVGVAFATACATIPVFFALSKAMLYDSMAQFLVASLGIALVACSQVNHAANGVLPRRRLLWSSGLVALLLALLLLTKQSTGVGAALGVACVLAIYPQSAPVGRRLLNALLVLAITLLAILTILGLLTPWVNFANCVQDVFLTGSEPKGGARRLCLSLAWTLLEVAVAVGITVLLAFFFNVGFGEDLPRIRARHLSRQEIDARGWRWIICAGTGSSLIAFAGALIYAHFRRSGDLIRYFHLDLTAATILNVGLVLGLGMLGSSLLSRRLNAKSCGPMDWETKYVIVFAGAALGHNLSAMTLRWFYDNNPLIFSTLAILIGKSAAVQSSLVGRRSKFTAVWPPLSLGLVVVSLWILSLDKASLVARCTERWPEVNHLAHARLRQGADGMRELVKAVRSLVPSDSQQEVLILPNDPGVESWFERKRPQLSCAIVFVDQYWDRYVEDDFSRLQNDPPNVIVIGPRDFWRKFARIFQTHWGAERLIDLVQDKLIPDSYELKQSVRIQFGSGTDFMDVYVRKEKAP